MPNDYFQFRQFRIDQQHEGLKVTTDACLFGAWVANEIKQSKEPKRILDIGTGTGLLALMLAQATQHASIMAVELDAETFQQAVSNIEKAPWSNRIHAHQSSIQDFQSNERFDLIICNPPFFHKNQKGKKSTLNLALHDESLPIDDLVNSVKRLLSPEGAFYVMYPEREMNAFTSAAIRKGLHNSSDVIVRNEVGKPIFRVMSKFSLEQKEMTRTELIIRRADGKYTSEFWELLKPYYLPYNGPSA